MPTRAWARADSCVQYPRPTNLGNALDAYIVEVTGNKFGKPFPLTLDINKPENCQAAKASGANASITEHSVYNKGGAAFVMIEFGGAGLRVFDLRDGDNPKEVAYYNDGKGHVHSGVFHYDDARGIMLASGTPGGARADAPAPDRSQHSACRRRPTRSIRTSDRRGSDGRSRRRFDTSRIIRSAVGMPGAPLVALGLTVKTGRAIVVALRGPAASPQILVKTRVDVATTFDEGAVYHAGQELGVAKARALIERSERTFTERARAALTAVMEPLGARVAAAILVAPEPKTPPPLETILKAHPLVHAAEIELYRRVFTSAVTALWAAPTRLPADQLAKQLAPALQLTPVKLEAQLAALGKAAGRPWTVDHKHATRAAWLAITRASDSPAQTARAHGGSYGRRVAGSGALCARPHDDPYGRATIPVTLLPWL